MKGLDNINIPKNIKDVTIKAVEKAESHKMKKRRTKKTFIIASITGVILIGSMSNSGVVSAAIEHISNRFESFYNKNYGTSLKGNTLEEYKSVVGKMVEDKGVKITLNEFYMDDKYIYINTKQDCRDINERSRSQEASIFINGNKIDATQSKANFIYNKDESVDVLAIYEFSNVKLPEVKDVKISYNRFECESKIVDESGKEILINSQEEGDKVQERLRENKLKELKPKVINGNWSFDFKYDGGKIASQIVEKKVNRDFNINGVKFRVESVNLTPAKVVVYYQDDESNRGESRKYIRFGIKNKQGKVINDIGGTQRAKEIGSSNLDIMINKEDINIDDLEIIPSVNKDYDNLKYSNKDIIKLDFTK